MVYPTGSRSHEARSRPHIYRCRVVPLGNPVALSGSSCTVDSSMRYRSRSATLSPLILQEEGMRDSFLVDTAFLASDGCDNRLQKP